MDLKYDYNIKNNIEIWGGEGCRWSYPLKSKTLLGAKREALKGSISGNISIRFDGIIHERKKGKWETIGRDDNAYYFSTIKN